MKVIINYQEYPDVEVEKSILRAAFPAVQIVESRTCDPSQFIHEAHGAKAALVQYVPVGREVIDAIPECQGYVRYGTGYDNIDVNYATKSGKVVANVPNYCTDEVSNHALAMLLALNRKLLLTHRLIVEDRYSIDKIRPIIRLKDSTVGIVGMGNMGRSFGEKVRPLVKRVLVYDPYVDHPAGCEKVELVELCATADYISLHLPLLPETRNLIDRQLLEVMKPTACVINTGRGGTLDEEALAELLRDGRLGGAGLDVIETEPLPQNSPLRELSNVILTGHNAWYSEGSIRELKETAARQVIQILEGNRPNYAIA